MTEYNENFIAKHPKFVNISNFFDKLFHSIWYLLFLSLVSVLGFAFNKEILSIFILVFAVALNLAVSRDISPAFFATILITLVPMKFANTPLDGFYVVAYAAIFFIPAVVLRFIFFPFHFVKGKNLIPLIVFSVGLILGGAFSDITASEYFAFYPIYTVIGLGLFQVIIYIFWQSYTPVAKDDQVNYFAKMMSTLGLVCILMVAITYINYYVSNPGSGFKFVFFSWKNYIADVFMLCMPFAFYLATVSKFKIAYCAFGLLQYLTIIFTQSGGGMGFATLMMPFLIIYTLIKIDKKQRIILISVLAALCISILAFVVVKRDIFIALYQKKIETGGTDRLNLYKIAIAAFKQYPIFGVGYGHVDEYMIKAGFIMTYYHSTLFQALAATGIVGLLCYAFMAFFRLKTFIKKNAFNIFLLIGFLGFAGYSMVDVGTVMPFPFSVICTFMLVITEKHNSYRLDSKKQ